MKNESEPNTLGNSVDFCGRFLIEAIKFRELFEVVKE